MRIFDGMNNVSTKIGNLYDKGIIRQIPYQKEIANMFREMEGIHNI
jgi:hypothetical protein